MRDMEKSLVERIADVDDDRRRSAVQLRKALETHREEIRVQRRRDHNAILVLAGIGIILLAAGLLLFAQLVKTRNAMEARIAAVEQAREPIAEPDTAAADLQAEVDQLGDAVEAIGDRLTALEGASRQPAASRPAADAAADAAAAAEQRKALEARMAALLDERLESLEARIDELRATRQALASDDVDRPAAETAGTGEPAAAAPAAVTTLTTDKDMVVLQLAGLPNHAAVERFIARHALPARVYLKADTLRGRTWYGLIAGLYPDMPAAEAARDALPPDLARLDIWLRELPAGTKLEVLGERD